MKFVLVFRARDAGRRSQRLAHRGACQTRKERVQSQQFTDAEAKKCLGKMLDRLPQPPNCESVLVDASSPPSTPTRQVSSVSIPSAFLRLLSPQLMAELSTECWRITLQQ